MDPTFLESLTADQALTAIYIGYYDRAPDPVGFAFWQETLANGFDLNMDGDSLDDIADNFSGQEETLVVHPFFSNPTDASASAFVTELYANLFNRAPDDAGLEFWTGQLQSAIAGTGDMTTGEIILAIIAGAQTAADGGFPDQEIITNKIAVAQAWEAAANSNNIAYEGDAIDSSRDIIDNVDETDGSLVIANAAIAQFVIDNEGGTPSTPGDLIILSSEAVRDNLTGTDGNDTFEAYNSELMDGDRLDGGAGDDTLTYFSSDNGSAISAITTSVESVVATIQTNDETAQADNNVGGFDNDLEVDVELDAGQMTGVSRWEDYDSRADLVIEDARDLDDTDGTFTGDITVAMVSTDPGHVDYAVYFDGPVNTSQNFGTLEIRVLDQEAAFGLPAPSASSTGYLNESSLVSFKFTFDDQDIEVTLADELGVTYGPDVSFQDLLVQVQNATQLALAEAGVTDLNFAASLGAPVSVGVGDQFTLPIVLTFDVTAESIDASNDNIVVLGRDQSGNDATDTFGSLSTDRTTNEELIRLNVELDDVGKGSMGGDALFGAMSTGRQNDDQGTSDSIGIQQFDIEVDRSSQLQTINSTNNALEVVNISNGENSGTNNTTTAADEMIGDLVVRGDASPGNNNDTNNAMPGAEPQHNDFGFSDVRTINASAMIGAVDITAELTEEIVEKYLDIQDDNANGEADDVLFTYALGNNNDEFLLNMSDEGFNSAGTGSREDFDLNISGGAGNDVITTNVGDADKRIDEQGQDHYELDTSNNDQWYNNSVANNAASLSVAGGTGNDTIWTHGYGDFAISDGTGNDVVYTDNSAAVEARFNVPTNIDRNLTEHDQIDYVMGAVWAFNAETFGGTNITGATNDTFQIGTGLGAVTATSGNATITITYAGASGVAGTEYVITATIPFSELIIDATTGNVSITDQTLNQAIKDGINNDGVLSNMLEAVDGPGHSLVVVSKTDGVHLVTDLDVDIATVTVNNATLAPILLVAADYTTPLFNDFAGASTAESDNTITVAGDSNSDVFVLSTSDTAAAQPVVNGTLDALTDLNEASNETLVFNSNFGIDTVFNFDIGDASGNVDLAEDVLDFSSITGVANSLIGAGVAADITAVSVDGTVDILALASVDGVDGSTANGTVEASEILFLAGAGDITASNHIYIVHDTTGDNGGEVWHVVDGTAATADVTATEVGTINLVGTDWTTVDIDNIA